MFLALDVTVLLKFIENFQSKWEVTGNVGVFQSKRHE